MEAGGFEPPSRDVSRQASTCLVASFGFRFANRQTTGYQLRYFGEFSPYQPEKLTRQSCILTPLSNSQAKSEKNGLLIKQPYATVCCQLKFSAGLLSRPTGVLGMRLDHPPSGRSHSPPIYFLITHSISYTYAVIPENTLNYNTCFCDIKIKLNKF